MVADKEKLYKVRWQDNKPVTIISSLASAFPTANVKRYSKEDKSRTDVKCPNVIKEYNTYMEGVDLAGMLVSLYRIEMKSRRWYLQLFAHMINVALNSTLLLRRR